MRAYLSLARWPNALISAAGVLTGAWWAAGEIPPAARWAAAGALPLTAFANAANDVADLEIDRVAHPDRPLPSGALTVTQAKRFALGSALIALALEGVAARELAALTVVVLALMLLYSRSLSAAGGLFANLLVALLASLPFYYGAIVTGFASTGMLLVLAALPLHLARELSKDLEDATGDAGHRRTVPLAHGVRNASIVVDVATCMFLAALGMLGARDHVLWLLALPAVASALLAVRAVHARRTGAPRLFKLAMVGVLAALVLTRLVTS